jgi:hypothetical protein
MRTIITFIRPLAVVAITVATISCGDSVRTGTSPAYLVIDSMAGIRGAATAGGQATAVLISDVITNVTTPAPCTPASPCPTVFGDSGQVSMHLALKNPSAQAAPSQFNAITINRVHVEYVRADGRATPGVDVPYAWDGAVTGTVSSSSPVTLSFELVRITAKEESPLVQLRNSSQFITVSAKVTFYGQDQTGNAASVTGSIQIDFGNFGDPA